MALVTRSRPSDDIEQNMITSSACDRTAALISSSLSQSSRRHTCARSRFSRPRQGATKHDAIAASQCASARWADALAYGRPVPRACTARRCLPARCAVVSRAYGLPPRVTFARAERSLLLLPIASHLSLCLAAPLHPPFPCCHIPKAVRARMRMHLHRAPIRSRPACCDCRFPVRLRAEQPFRPMPAKRPHAPSAVACRSDCRRPPRAQRRVAAGSAIAIACASNTSFHCIRGRAPPGVSLCPLSPQRAPATRCHAPPAPRAQQRHGS